ncbi:MAG: Maf family protein [Anaerolineae bacterium]|nr:Maf family protein [Anaerolineae bacterium]MDH7475416.1 nucleoside triphosphate pyrophosphatase [Anaerolineae bacterium]
MKPKLTLASASPRRRQLLALLGLPFEIYTADVEEHPRDGESPCDLVRRLSEDKVRAVAERVDAGLIVGADTIVALEGEMLGKPAHDDEAASMLRRLRNREHQVYTGVSVLDTISGRLSGVVVMSSVWLRDYSNQEMMSYVRSGAPLDKAGAYAIQDGDFCPVERVEGCYANVMGLPLCHLYRLLVDTGVDIEVPPAAACEAFTGRRCSVAVRQG